MFPQVERLDGGGGVVGTVYFMYEEGRPNVVDIVTTIAAEAAVEAIESLQKDRWNIHSLQYYYNTLNINFTSAKKGKALTL